MRHHLGRALPLALSALCLGLAAPGQAAPVPGGKVLTLRGNALPGGDEETLSALYELRTFSGLNGNQFLSQMWADPYRGSDTTGTGSFAAPFKSFAKLKAECLAKPHMRCTVKGSGRGRVFSPLTYTVSGIAGGESFQHGEGVTWSGSTGTVLDWDGSTNTIVLARLTGTDPALSVALTGAQSGATATTATRADTLGGHPTITPTAIDTAANTFTFTAHPYTNNQGPLRFFQSGSSVTGVTEGTDYYACAVAANTFTVQTSSTCAGAAADLGGTVDGQWTGASNVGVITPLAPVCTNRDRICSLLESEDPDSPATLDANGFYPVGVSYAEASADFWPSDFNIGGMLSVDGTLAGGFLGIQNLVIQNVAHDAFGSLGPGKLIALNLETLNIRNGASDRSTGSAATAHNSCVIATAEGGTGLGSVVYWLNGRGSNDQGSSIASGSCLNPNQEGALRLISRGEFSTDVIAGDTNCGGGQCPGNIMVAPGGDTVVLGPTLTSIAGAHASHFITSNHAESTGPKTRKQFYRALWNVRNTGSGSGAFQWTANNAITEVFLNEVTIRHAGSGSAAAFVSCGFCFDEDCTGSGGPATDGQGLFDLRNLLIDNAPYWWYGSDCGNPNLDPDSSISKVRMHWSGIYDDEDAAGGDATEWFHNPTAYATRTTYRSAQIALLTDDDRWNFLEAGSFNSGAGADGTQWGTDAAFRCQAGQECYHAASGGPYLADFSSVYGSDSDDACLPADVLGAPVCGLELVPTHIGGR